MINVVLGTFIKPGTEEKQNQERGLYAVLF